LSTDLSVYGYVAEPGQVFIKDWSEHAGLADALVLARVVSPLESLRVGPFSSRAYRVRVLDEVVRLCAPMAAATLPTCVPAGRRATSSRSLPQPTTSASTRRP